MKSDTNTGLKLTCTDFKKLKIKKNLYKQM